MIYSAVIVVILALIGWIIGFITGYLLAVEQLIAQRTRREVDLLIAHLERD
jgi:hypothetical protein